MLVELEARGPRPALVVEDGLVQMIACRRELPQPLQGRPGPGIRSATASAA